MDPDLLLESLGGHLASPPLAAVLSGRIKLSHSSWLIFRGLESWEAGMLEGSEAYQLPGFLASRPYSFQAYSFFFNL
jgi:hypothetical protein